MNEYEDKIKQYQQAHTEKKIFRGGNAEAQAKEILATYKQAIAAGYKPTQDDDTIRFIANVIMNPKILEEIIKAGDEPIKDSSEEHEYDLGGEN